MMISNCARVFKRGLDHLSLSGRRQKSLINYLIFRANRSQISDQVYAPLNQFFFIDHWRSLSSMHLFDMSSNGGDSCSDNDRIVNCHGTGFIEASPTSTSRQSISAAADDDHDISRLSGQHSQIGSTSSLGVMYVYRTESGLWEFANSDSVSHIICEMLKERITSFWPVFSKVPSVVKDHWFEEFKALYEWDPSTSFVDVRRLWERKCRLKHSQIVSTMKEYDMSFTCINSEVWRQFVEYWEREDVKELAKKISGTRKKNSKEFRYGYQVMTQLVNDMKKKIGRTLTYMEAHIQLHYVEKSDVTKDTEWINIYLEQLLASYDKRVAQVTEFLGRELSHDELNHLFIHFNWVRDASKKVTHEPDIGNNVEMQIYKDDTCNVKSTVLDDRESLMVVRELCRKVGKLEKKKSLLGDFIRDMMQER